MSNPTTVDAASLSSAFASANRGPLTTIFTPPASCLEQTTLLSWETTAPAAAASIFTTTKVFVGHYRWGDISCYPSTIATLGGEINWENGYYYCMSSAFGFEPY
jgi:hypothetical protein